MILDSSAVVAAVFAEANSQQILARIVFSPRRRISAANLLETYMVVDRSGLLDAELRVDRFLSRVNAVIEPVTADQIVIAREAFHRFGKGSGHQAKLNFGDCFAYALARFYGEPLLFIGSDFSATDIEPALPASGI